MNPRHPLFLAFQREFRAGRYFEAHEVLEELWIESNRPARGRLRGLVQLAVACEHYRRGNGGGARRVFERARTNILFEAPADARSLTALARNLADDLPGPLPPLPVFPSLTG